MTQEIADRLAVLYAEVPASVLIAATEAGQRLPAGPIADRQLAALEAEQARRCGNRPSKLYTAARLAGYSTAELDVLAAMTEHDITCPNSLYSGMDRAETIATARQSNADIADRASLLPDALI